MTLNGRYALYCRKDATFGPTTKIWMKIDPYYRRQKCRPMTLVSGYVRFMRIFEEVPWAVGVKRQCMGLSRKAIFSVFAGYFLETLEMRLALLYSDSQSVIGFLAIPKCMTLNDLERLFCIEFCFRTSSAGTVTIYCADMMSNNIISTQKTELTSD